MRHRLVYGPVPSRRLGLSLGVDVVPYKVCPYDCLYCQVGITTERTLVPRFFAEVDPIVRQVEAALGRSPSPQIITLSGSGEPTLYAGLAELAAGLRRITTLPLALLTGSALLWREEVASAALAFDLVAPSLDAADEETFSRINRPASGLSFATMLEGLEGFCRRYTGICRLEILLVKGVNDSTASLAELARLARSLKVTAVDLNTVVRPSAYEAVGLDREEMERAAGSFHGCEVEILGTARPAPERATNTRPTASLREQILDIVARRPCTLDDLCSALGRPSKEVLAACGEALREGAVERRSRDEATYFVAAEAPDKRTG